MDGKDEFYQGLDELADQNRRLVEGEADDGRPERGRELDVQLLQEIIYSLESVSMGTHQLLYFSAMKYVRKYLDCEADTMEGAVEELAEIFDAMNLGVLDLDGEDPVMLEMSENAMTHSAPEAGRTMCYFLSGYIAGFLENCLGENFVVSETSCSAEGEDSCRFKVRER